MYSDSFFKALISFAYNRLQDDLRTIMLIYDDAIKLSSSKISELLSRTDEIENNFESLTAEERQLLDDLDSYGSRFQAITLDSLFTTSYSFFEYFVTEICKLIENTATTEIKLKHIRGNDDLDRLVTFLHLIHKIQSANNTSLTKISSFKKIRNLMVHHKNHFKEANKVQDKTFLSQYKVHFFRRDIGFRIRDRKFLQDFKDTAIDYAKTLVDEITSVTF